MIITLYINTAENNRVDKSSYLQQVVELDGTLRDSSSLIAPIISFELPNLAESLLIDEDDEEISSPDDDVIIQSDIFYRFNYVYIKEFNRYYYVQDINIVRSHYFIVSLVVDTLMTYKDNILSLDAMIERNQFTYDGKLADDIMPLSLEKDIQEYEPVPGALVNASFDPSLEDGTYCIAITLMGEPSRLAFEWYEEDIIPPTGSGLPRINPSNLSSSSRTSLINLFDYDSIILKLLGQNSTYKDAVLSIIAYPFDIKSLYTNPYYLSLIFGTDADGHWRDMKYAYSKPSEGKEAGGSIKGYMIPTLSKYIVIADFTIEEGLTFRSFEPFAQYELYIPFFGWTKLDYNLIKGHRLLVYYALNREDGSATAYVWDQTSKRLLFSTTCQIGLKLSLSSSNQEELTAQKNAIRLNLAVGLISSMVSVGAGIMTANPMMAIGGGLVGAKTIASSYNSLSMQFPRASASFGDSATSLYSPLRVRLRITKTRATPSDMGGFRKLYGSPLRQIRTLSSLSGFTIVSDIHLENLNAFKREKEEIERLLKTGVIL